MIIRELLAKFGVAFDDSGAKKADKAVSGLKGALTELAGIVGGVAIVRGFGHFIAQQVELADSIGDTAERIGVGTTALQELRFAGADVGMSMEGVDMALQRLVQSQALAADGNKEALEGFKDLNQGLTQSELKNLSFEDLLARVANGMGEAKTAGDRLRIGTKLLGREGAKFTATMADGNEGLQEMRIQALKLGGVLSEDQVEAADKADKAMARFGARIQGIKNEIASRFIPKLTEALDWLGRWVTKGGELIRTSNILTGAIGAVGIALTAMIGPEKLLAMGLAALAFATIALAIDDVVTFAQDGDSALGRLIDHFKGMGSSVVALENWKVGFHILVEEAEKLYDLIVKIDKALAARRDREAKEKYQKEESANKHDFESQHLAWQNRKQWIDEHPGAPEWLKYLPKEPQYKPLPPPQLEGNSNAWEELRTRQVATQRGMGDGPLALPGGAESAEEHAREKYRLSGGLPVAVAVQPGGRSWADSPLTVNQTNELTVNATGANPDEVAAIFERHYRDMTNVENAKALRSTRQVGRSR